MNVFFLILVYIIFIVHIGIRKYFYGLHKNNRGELSHESSDKAIIKIVEILWILTLGSFVVTFKYDYLSLGLPLWISWCGVGGAIISQIIFYKTHIDLGENWSTTLEIKNQHRLITTGIYRHVRHPMYSSYLLYFFSQFLMMNNWVGLPIFIAIVLKFIVRVKREEEMLYKYFGEDYKIYCNNTGRIIPKLF